MSPDESATLMDVRQMLGTLNTALATITTQVEYLSQGKASQVAPMSAQSGKRDGGNPTVAPLTSTRSNSSGPWSSTALGLYAPQHWPSLLMRQTGRMKEGSWHPVEAPTPQVSSDQLTLQPLIESFGPMNMCTPLKASLLCMSPCDPWPLSPGT